MDCSDGGWRTAAVMFGVPGVGVLAAGELGGELHLLVESTRQVEGCRSCGVVAVAHGRREHLLRDAPFGHRPVVVMWRKGDLPVRRTGLPGHDILARTTRWAGTVPR